MLACILTDPPGGLSEKARLTVGRRADGGLVVDRGDTDPGDLAVADSADTPARHRYPDQGHRALRQPDHLFFLGGFLLGSAMQRWNLHKRIALATLLAVGNQPSRQIAGFMIATAFISMWVSNTATSIMMLPIGLSVIGLLIAGSEEKEGARFAVALLLGIAYSASVGGIATLIGTAQCPAGGVHAGELRRPDRLRPVDAAGLPLSIGMLVFIWWSLTRGGFARRGRQPWSARKEMAALGPMSRAEKMVAVVFVLAAAA